MKNFFQKYGITTAILLLFSLIAYGAIIGENSLRLGDLTGSDVEIQMGDGRLKWDTGTSKMQFSEDGGSGYSDIGAAGSATPALDVASVSLLDNALFESDVASWTASAGTLAQETAGAQVGIGAGSMSWTPAAGADTLTADLVAIPNALLSYVDCDLDFYYKGKGHTVEVWDGSSAVASLSSLDDVAVWTRAQVTFDCPASGSLSVRIVAADNSIVRYDNMMLGLSSVGKDQLKKATTYFARVGSTAGTCAGDEEGPIDWIDNVSTGGTGNCVMNFTAGFWESVNDFNCTCTGAESQTYCFLQNKSTSSIRVLAYDNTFGSTVDQLVYIQCAHSRGDY